MKNKSKKILSVALVILYALSTLGFVVKQNNCRCCIKKCLTEVAKTKNTGCCVEKTEVKICCSASAKTYEKSSFCMCDKIKCAKSDYIKNNYKTVAQTARTTLIGIKNFYVENISIFDQNSISEEIIKFLKTDPPPVLVKDSSYIIALSKLKIPACNLI